MDVREFFGLRELPFTREIESSRRIPLDSIENVSRNLENTIRNRLSAAVTGGAGCGKTVLIRSLEERLPASQFKFVYLKLSALNIRELCRSLSVGLGFEPRASVALFMRDFDSHISTIHSEQNLHPVIVFDDAQDLRTETLRLVRSLTNFQMDSKLWVSIILIGQVGLKTKLMENSCEDVRHRLSYKGELSGLSREESDFYIGQRVQLAGGNSKKLLFSGEALSLIYEKTHGNMRAIDILARSSMDVCAQKNEEREVIGAHVMKGAEKVWMQ